MPDAAGAQVLSVVLDRAPPSEWLAVLSAHADHFKLAHGLRDLRVVGANLNLVGRREVLRGLAPAVRGLVEMVGQRLLGGRMLRGTGPAQPPLPTALTLATWVDDELLDLVPDVHAILLDTLGLTGMRFATIARVKSTRWTSVAFYDGMDFGMAPHQELVLEQTICDEVRCTHALVAFEQASKDPKYASSAIPSMYGFESYISIPILTVEGQFFGTLCALDPAPCRISPATLEQLRDRADRIGLSVQALVARDAD